MLEKILDFIHNYFVKEVYRGKFKIESQALNVDFLLDGQYFKIKGSVLNDGVHQYPAELVDEEFIGEVWAMAVPRSLLNLVDEIEAWNDANGAVADGPYQSESFGGYSYTKASTTAGQNGTSKLAWQSKFGSQLNAYRKIS